MSSSDLQHIVAFVCSWQRITHNILHIIMTIFGRGSIAANFPVGAASPPRPTSETFNGVLLLAVPLPAGEYFPNPDFPDVEQSKWRDGESWTKHTPMIGLQSCLMIRL